MHENTLIDILRTNKLMRSNEEVTAFENALAELAKNPNSEYLPELYLVLDDKCQHQGVMFGLIHFLESFDVKEQIQALLDVLPQMLILAPEWTVIIYSRIFNDESAYVTYQSLLYTVDADIRTIASKVMEGIAQEYQPMKT